MSKYFSVRRWGRTEGPSIDLRRTKRFKKNEACSCPSQRDTNIYSCGLEFFEIPRFHRNHLLRLDGFGLISSSGSLFLPLLARTMQNFFPSISRNLPRGFHRVAFPAGQKPFCRHRSNSTPPPHH